MGEPCPHAEDGCMAFHDGRGRHIDPADCEPVVKADPVEEMITFDTVAAPVGTVFYNELLDLFVRKSAPDTWVGYRSDNRPGAIWDDVGMMGDLTEEDEVYDSNGETGQTPA